MTLVPEVFKARRLFKDKEKGNHIYNKGTVLRKLQKKEEKEMAGIGFYLVHL